MMIIVRKEMRRLSKWIRTDDHLPEQYETVLLSIWGSDYMKLIDGETFEEAFERYRKTVRYVTIGFLGSDGWYGPDGYPLMVAPIAWMRLPEVYDGV